jgi:MHS family proline/betaine transporter-like MFS transporter
MMISTGQVWMIVAAQVIYAMLAAFFSGPLNFFMQSLFPVEDRYSGISFSYSMGMAVFGGSTLLIMETLRVHVDYSFSPALWLTVSALAASLVLTFLYPKIKKSAQ